MSDSKTKGHSETNTKLLPALSSVLLQADRNSDTLHPLTTFHFRSTLTVRVCLHRNKNHLFIYPEELPFPWDLFSFNNNNLVNIHFHSCTFSKQLLDNKKRLNHMRALTSIYTLYWQTVGQRHVYKHLSFFILLRKSFEQLHRWCPRQLCFPGKWLPHPTGQ